MPVPEESDAEPDQLPATLEGVVGGVGDEGESPPFEQAPISALSPSSEAATKTRDEGTKRNCIG